MRIKDVPYLSVQNQLDIKEALKQYRKDGGVFYKDHENALVGIFSKYEEIISKREREFRNYPDL